MSDLHLWVSLQLRQFVMSCVCLHCMSFIRRYPSVTVSQVLELLLQFKVVSILSHG